MRLKDLDEQHFYQVYRGAEPLATGDRGKYFSEVMALLTACTEPLSAKVVSEFVGQAQRKFNRSLSQPIKD
jgi:hypothetical protein